MWEEEAGGEGFVLISIHVNPERPLIMTWNSQISLESHLNNKFAAPHNSECEHQ